MKQRQQNHELQKAQLKAEIALAERDLAQKSRIRFLQTVGHELRTPLNGLLHTGTEINSEKTSEELQTISQAVMTSTSRLDDAIEALVLHAKLSGDDGVSIPLPFSGLDLVNGICADLNEANRVKVVSLAFADTIWLGDRDAARFAVKAILNNALCYSEEDVEIYIQGGDDCQIDILDRGCGPGAWVEQSTSDLIDYARKQQGLGIQVATQALGGSLSFLPRDGGGTCARLRFSLNQAGATIQHSACRARTVLVVDDDRLNRSVLRRLVEQLNCEVMEAEDGKQAVEAGLKHKPGMILMDCEMPVMDGWSATRALRAELGPDTPIVAVTAYVANADRLRCLEAGMNDVLAKPVRRKLFEATLKHWLQPLDT